MLIAFWTGNFEKSCHHCTEWRSHSKEGSLLAWSSEAWITASRYTKKFNKRWPCKVDHICTINSLIITPICVILLFVAVFCGTMSGQVRLLYHYKHCSNQMVVSLEFLLPKVSISSPPMHKKEKRNRFHFSFPSSVFVTNLQFFV